jgi:beta-glucosidase
MGGLVGGDTTGRWKKESAEVAADPAAELKKAVELARTADVAIVFVGTTAAVEQEARDRKTLGLTGTQEELVEAVQAVNPRTIVVEMSAGPLTVPWIVQNVPSLLQAWWAGEEGGHAIAGVLFGDVNPAGRLPHTVYASEARWMNTTSPKASLTCI